MILFQLIVAILLIIMGIKLIKCAIGLYKETIPYMEVHGWPKNVYTPAHYGDVQRAICLAIVCFLISICLLVPAIVTDYIVPVLYKISDLLLWKL